jgi:hypothetical protein
MNSYARSTGMRLAKDCLLRIYDELDMSVRVSSGVVWITQEGDTNDYILQNGDRFSISKRGLTIVSALADATVLLKKPDRKTDARSKNTNGFATVSKSIVSALARFAG